MQISICEQLGRHAKWGLVVIPAWVTLIVEAFLSYIVSLWYTTAGDRFSTRLIMSGGAITPCTCTSCYATNHERRRQGLGGGGELHHSG